MRIRDKFRRGGSPCPPVFANRKPARYWPASLLLSVICHLSFVIAPSFAAPPVIVVPEQPSWLGQHAGEELASYVRQITGERAKLTPAAADLSLPKGTDYFLVGSPDRNAVTARLADAWAIPALKRIPTHPDGFVIASGSVDGARVVVMAGRTEIATLYAVYHYLDQYCDVGFFEDGERVPRRQEMPFENIETITWPKFSERIQFAWDPRCLLKKSVSTLWRADPDWKNYWDFMAKNKMNWARLDVQNIWRLGYGLYHHLYPDVPIVEDFDEMVPAWWPPEYVYDNTREAVRLGRERGIKLWYDAPGFAIPARDREVIRSYFPDVQYSNPDPSYPYGVYIRDPKTLQAFYRRNIEGLLEYVGPPDMWWLVFPPEEMDAFYEAGSLFKSERANLMVDIVKEFVPDARFLMDGWLARMRYGSPDRAAGLKTLVDGIHADITCNVSYDAPGEVSWGAGETRNLIPSPQLFNYYWGYPWHYTFIESFGGTDHLHLLNPYPLLMKNTKDALTHPNSNCIGYGDIPELIGYDPLMRFFHTRLAWDPFVYADWTDVVKEFVKKRYGPEAYDNMLASYTDLCAALNDARVHWDPYISGYAPVYRYMLYLSFPYVRGYTELYVDGQDVALLKQSLDKALLEAGRFSADDLYAKYISSVFHSYANEMFKFALIRCYHAYAQGTTALAEGDEAAVAEWQDKFEAAAAQADLSLAAIEQVWGTRPELSTEQEIKESTSVPGTSPLLTKTIRVDSAVYEEGAFETMAQWYRPLVNLFIDDLRQHLRARDTRMWNGQVGNEFFAFNWSEDPKQAWHRIAIRVNDPKLRPAIEKLVAQYEDGPIHVDRPFEGTTTAAVQDVLAKLQAAGCTLEDYTDMMTPELIKKNYAFEKVRMSISNGDFEQGNLGAWMPSPETTIGGTVDGENPRGGQYSFHIKGHGDAGVIISQKVVAPAGDFVLALDFFPKRMPQVACNLQMTIDGFDAQAAKKVHASWSWGTANWDHDTHKPGDPGFAPSFYTLKVLSPAPVGEWQHVEIHPGQAVDGAHGEGVWDSLGITTLVLAVGGWSARAEETDILEGFIDNVEVRGPAAAPVRM